MIRPCRVIVLAALAVAAASLPLAPGATACHVCEENTPQCCHGPCDGAGACAAGTGVLLREDGLPFFVGVSCAETGASDCFSEGARSAPTLP